jgi:hypothetical protein
VSILGVGLLLAMNYGASLESEAAAETPMLHLPKIDSIRVTRNVATFPFLGDLWASTWADDDRLYLSWGDGTGNRCAPTLDHKYPGALKPWSGSIEVSPRCFTIPEPNFREPVWRQFCRTFGCSTSKECFHICPFTDSGLMALSGPLPALTKCPEASGCIIARDLPGYDIPRFPIGSARKDDKVSSLLSIDGRLYYAGHTPSVRPQQGYIAFSGDRGRTWIKVMGSPWTGSSPFRILMFINMGQDYHLNEDGYVYALGTTLELDTTMTHPQPVYLARVHKNMVAEYNRYEYLSAVVRDGAKWSKVTAQAIPLAGLSTFATGSAIYHSGLGRYLFLTGVSTSPSSPNAHGTLFEAPNPWGPWKVTGTVPGVSISMLISKGASATTVFFTSAGGTEPYQLNIGRIDFTVGN